MFIIDDPMWLELMLLLGGIVAFGSLLALIVTVNDEYTTKSFQIFMSVFLVVGLIVIGVSIKLKTKENETTNYLSQADRIDNEAFKNKVKEISEVDGLQDFSMENSDSMLDGFKSGNYGTSKGIKDGKEVRVMVMFDKDVMKVFVENTGNNNSSESFEYSPKDWQWFDYMR